LNHERPAVTDDAKKALDEDKTVYGYKILNEAEKRALLEGRTQISESDVRSASRILLGRSSSHKKWIIRIAISALLPLLLWELSGFAELQRMPLLFELRLYVPTIFALFWVICFSYLFRDEWM